MLPGELKHYLSAPCSDKIGIWFCHLSGLRVTNTMLNFNFWKIIAVLTFLEIKCVKSFWLNYNLVHLVLPCFWYWCNQSRTESDF